MSITASMCSGMNIRKPVSPLRWGILVNPLPSSASSSLTIRSICLVCQGYTSDGGDYYKRKISRVACSDCDGSICACDDCDCSDWESGSERESEHECSSADENNDEDEATYSESDVEAGDEDQTKESDDKNEAKESNLEFVKVKDIQDSEGSDEDTVSESDESKKDGQPNSFETDVIEKGTKKENENSEDNDSESDKDGYPKEITEFLMKNETAETADNTGSRTRRWANYYNRSTRRHRHRRSSEESSPGQRKDYGYRRRGRTGNYRKKRFRRHLYSYAKMPSGSNHWITIPAAERSSWKCGNKPKLITLRPNGRMGRREYQLISREMEKTRKKHVSGAFTGYEIIKIQKIVNPCLWKRYRHRRRDVMTEGSVNEQLLFHGSPAYKDIIQTGFDERYCNFSGMFGAGLYFAENSSKSNQYVWGLNGVKGCPGHKKKNCLTCERQLILCRVLLGKTKELTAAQPLAHPPAGFHSVKGVPSVNGLQYSENIVYRGEQVYPEFLITYKLKL